MKFKAALSLLLSIAADICNAQPIPDTPYISSYDEISAPAIDDAIRIANTSLSSSSDYLLAGSWQTTSSTDQKTVIPVYMIALGREAPGVGIFVRGGISAIFIEPLPLHQLIKEASIDVTFPAQVIESLLSITHEIPEGGIQPNGSLGEDVTRLGLGMMKKLELKPQYFIAAFLLHEVGHIAANHTNVHEAELPASNFAWQVEDNCSKQIEADADAYAALSLFEALRDERLSQAQRTEAADVVGHLMIRGFGEAFVRVAEGGDLIRDTDDTHEAMELRIFRMARVLAAKMPFAGNTADLTKMLDDVIDARFSAAALARGTTAVQGGDAAALGNCPVAPWRTSLHLPGSRPQSAPAETQVLPEIAELAAGRILMKMGASAAAAAEFKRIMDKSDLDQFDPQRERLYTAYSNALYLSGDLAGAQEALSKALRIVDALALRERDNGLRLIGPLAVISNELGNVEDTRKYCAEALPLLEKFRPPDDFAQAVTQACTR